MARDMMKAIVQDRYGLPDVLRLEDIDTPVANDDQVLVRVQAAAVNIGDWHLRRGTPYVMRMATGPFKPRHDVPGLDLAGQVEAVGKAVTQLQPGKEVSAGAEAPLPSMYALTRATSCRSRRT